MSERVESLLAQLSLEEKVSLVAGADFWTTPGVERLGIPALKVTDGPSGARGGVLPGRGLRSASFPCGSALGATWNTDLVQRVGAAIAEEARTKGAHVLLGPTLNLHRSPLAGRNFECYSEDPELTARIGVAFVEGVQSGGVGACIKHLVCNDSEFERHTISSEIAPRPLREIYLRPFEAAVREAGAWSLMGAYNKVNGTYACEHPQLLTEILRDEWGFDGFVVSDWFATQSAVPAARSGMDLEMPGPPRHLGSLGEAVASGELEVAVVDEMVRRLLRVRERTGAFDQTPGPEQAVDRPKHRALAREAAREAIVLLKNEGDLLPLDDRALRRLAVVGPNAGVAIVQGGGSAQVTPHYSVSPLDGMRARCGERIEVVHERGCTNHRTVPILDDRFLTHRSGVGEGRLLVEYFAGESPDGEPLHSHAARRAEFHWFEAPAPQVPADVFSVRATATFAPPESGAYTFSATAAGRCRLLVGGRLVVDAWEPRRGGSAFFGAASPEVSGVVQLAADEPVEVEIQFAKARPGDALCGFRVGCLLPQPDDLMERAVRAAAEADAAIVVVGLDHEWEGEGGDRVDMELPGRQVELIRRIAAANPRTTVVLNAGSPVSMDWLPAVPAVLQLWYPGQESGNALAEVVFGEASPSGRLPTTFPRRIEDNPAYLDYPGEAGRVRYGEGVFIGYRYYDTKRVEPLFPFGHGLSYTTFELADLRTRSEEVGPGEAIEAIVRVENTGARASACVVQLYLRDVESRVARPEQELVAFRKPFLEPGESTELAIRIDPQRLAFWDEQEGRFVTEAGEFELRAGLSSRDIRARTTFRLKG